MLQAITVLERVPWRAGSALKLGRSMIVSCGAKAACSSRFGRISRWRMNSACQPFANHPARQPVIGIGPGIKILREQLPGARMVEKIELQPGKIFRRHGLVVIPPDRGLRGLVLDDVFVAGRTPRVPSGRDRQPAGFRDLAFAAAHRSFIERGGRRIPVNPAASLEPYLVQIVTGIDTLIVIHCLGMPPSKNHKAQQL